MVCSSCNLFYMTFSFSLQFWLFLGWLIERKKNCSKRKSMWHSETGIVVKTFLIKALWIFKKGKCFINSNYILIHFRLKWFGRFLYTRWNNDFFFSFQDWTHFVANKIYSQLISVYCFLVVPCRDAFSIYNTKWLYLVVE